MADLVVSNIVPYSLKENNEEGESLEVTEMEGKTRTSHCRDSSHFNSPPNLCFCISLTEILKQ